VEPPVTPSEPISPQVELSALLAALAGIVIAAAPILLLEYARQPVRSVEDLQRENSVSVLGVLGAGRPSRRNRGPQRLVIETMPRSHVADTFRSLAAELDSVRQSTRSLLVMGTVPGDGSGDVAANLAAALTESGRSVTLVDEDAGERSVSGLLAVREGTAFGLSGIASGTLYVRPFEGVAAELELDPVRARLWLDSLLESTNRVVVHAPAGASLTTLLWATAADATIVVVRRDLAQQDKLTATVDRLQRVGATVLGLVFDSRRPPRFRLPSPLTAWRRTVADARGSSGGAGDASDAGSVAHADRHVAPSYDSPVDGALPAAARAGSDREDA
jgi:Mrp family chromosome partitioning ATPase